MTRNEAIKYLIGPFATSTEPSEEYMKQKEAYNMAIEALKRKRGEWIYKGREPRIEQIYKCSVCERYNHEKSNYCPNCGAEMKEKA